MKMSLCISVLCCATSYSLMAQAVCTPAPDCASLGYNMTAADCEGQIMVKCPTDTSKVFCNVKVKEEVETAAILYSDGTVNKQLLSNKTPIGIVFDEINHLAIALTDVKKDGAAGTEGIYWLSYYYDIPSLENCSSSEIPLGTNLTPISCGADGKDNTNKILACGSSCGNTPAATTANNYQPTSCVKDFCKKSNWFLPSLRDLQNIYLQKTQINASLALLSGYGATAIKDSWYYWSSTEYSNMIAWSFRMSDGFRSPNDKSTSSYYVRPVIYYSEANSVAELPILYGDGTTSKEIVADKTPIGIVFDEDNRLAVALTDVKKDGTAGSETVYWANNYHDIPSLENCTDDSIADSISIPVTCGTDGRSNTDKILACGNGCGGTPAATAVNSYQPAGCAQNFCKKTKWFLPSLRDLQNIYQVKKQLDATLSLLNNFETTNIGTKYYWSSTEYGDTYAWTFLMDGIRNLDDKVTQSYIRPVIAY